MNDPWPGESSGEAEAEPFTGRLADDPAHHYFDADDGLRLHYAEWPAAPGAAAILMVHGRRAHAHWFDAIIPDLSPRYLCASLDLRAHGDSGRGGEADFGRYASDIAQFAARFAGRPRILLPHSMAGRPTLYAISEHGLRPDLLVMADTPLARRPHHFRPEPPVRNKRFPDRETAISRFRLMPGGTNAHPAILRRIAERSIRQNKDGSWGWKFDEEMTTRPVGFKMPDYSELPIESVECPTLVINGEHSVLMDAEDAQSIASRFPRGEWKTIADAHHHLMLDRPAEFSAALLSFFARHGL